MPEDSCSLDADIQELTLPKTCSIDIPDPDDLLNFKVVITPDEVSPAAERSRSDTRDAW